MNLDFVLKICLITFENRMNTLVWLSYLLHFSLVGNKISVAYVGVSDYKEK